jgi:hypothetical protein
MCGFSRPMTIRRNKSTRFGDGRTIKISRSPDGTRLAVARDIDDERHRAIQGLEAVIGAGAR